MPPIRFRGDRSEAQQRYIQSKAVERKLGFGPGRPKASTMWLLISACLHFTKVTQERNCRHGSRFSGNKPRTGIQKRRCAEAMGTCSDDRIITVRSLHGQQRGIREIRVLGNQLRSFVYFHTVRVESFPADSTQKQCDALLLKRFGIREYRANSPVPVSSMVNASQSWRTFSAHDSEQSGNWYFVGGSLFLVSKVVAVASRSLDAVGRRGRG